jgi:hypothetical protein
MSLSTILFAHERNVSGQIKLFEEFLGIGEIVFGISMLILGLIKRPFYLVGTAWKCWRFPMVPT